MQDDITRCDIMSSDLDYLATNKLVARNLARVYNRPLLMSYKGPPKGGAV